MGDNPFAPARSATYRQLIATLCLKGQTKMNKRLNRRQCHQLRIFAEEAHERELSEAMMELYEDFQEWGGDQISVFDLTERIHKFHDGISRELYKRYVLLDPEFGVAHALNHGILGAKDVGENLVKALGNMVDIEAPKDNG